MATARTSRSSSASKTSLGRYPALDIHYAPAPDAGLLQDLLYAELDAFEPLAIHENETADAWRVFFRHPPQRDAARAALSAALGGRLLDISAVDVDDEDWARRSQAALTAIQAGRITIAPPWDVPLDRVSSATDAGIVIVIEPSMGFGTGHHATTRLCLELLQELDVRGSRVVDVGTGSGILALAAWRLGASAVTAVDHDPDALQSARENIARNGGGAAIDVVQADLSGEPALRDGDLRADVVLANLTGAVLERHAAALVRLAARDAVLVMSGFSPDEADGVAAAFGLVPRRILREGEWAAMILAKRQLN